MKKMVLLVGVLLSLVACASPAVGTAPAEAASPTAGPAPTEAASPAVGPTPAEASSAAEECPICQADANQYSGALDQQEIEGLLLALNDEYYAWAVYDQVIKDFGQIRPFVNIIQAEAKHIDSLLSLFRAYDVPIPDNPWVDSVPGFDTVGEACAGGVEAEIANAALYDDLFATTERDDILTVFRSLQRASQEKHLPAFQRCAD